jgi:NadR type nicotinamide-nucleotide adenylyltransferase
MNKKVGVVLNGHRPPHNGHVYMVEFAQAYVDELHLGVCTLDSEPIPANLRLQWSRELFPNAHVRLCHNMPQAFYMDYDDPALWGRVIKEHMGLDHVDYIFASEDYGKTIGAEVGAKHIPIDYTRCTVPVSGSMIRKNPMMNWDYIPPVVRPFFVKRVCIIGAEYTGKSELAHRLAARYNTVVVDEYAKAVYNSQERGFTAADIELIARGQMAAEDSLARQANRVLICNTDLLTTFLWASERSLKGPAPKWLMSEIVKRDYDLYLFMSADGISHTIGNTHTTAASWHAFSVKILETLIKERRQHIELIGNEMNRMQTACMAIDDMISSTPEVSARSLARWNNG